MPHVLELAEKEIPNFCGYEHANGDLEEGVACLKPGRNVFIGSDKILVGALAQGFDSAIITAANMFPELPIEIFKHVRSNEWHEAMAVQTNMNKRFDEIFPANGDWVRTMKAEFNKSNQAFSVGPIRKPAWNNKLY